MQHWARQHALSDEPPAGSVPVGCHCMRTQDWGLCSRSRWVACRHSRRKVLCSSACHEGSKARIQHTLVMFPPLKYIMQKELYVVFYCIGDVSKITTPSRDVITGNLINVFLYIKKPFQPSFAFVLIEQCTHIWLILINKA